jgi:hypothetical protein
MIELLKWLWIPIVIVIILTIFIALFDWILAVCIIVACISAVLIKYFLIKNK